MATHIKSPTEIQAAGNPPKLIREYIGVVNSGTRELSVAHMLSPAGWSEPGQTPEFDEYTVVLKGSLSARTKDGQFTLRAGEALIVEKGEWVQYSSPEAGGAEYIAVCLPAFTSETVRRDEP